ncbi:GyrI-like domain-containing protein [Shewanella maritima]|uniref:AraC family transcriptional regulator n=1 Tax=Shewanella maritima TaxID=2520507 RepID=UPI0037361FD1
MSSRFDTQFERALAYIDAHLNEQFTIEQLAEIAQLPVCHFSFLFRSLYRTSIEDYTRLLRLLDSAQRLAFNPEESLGQVASHAGFSSEADFKRDFERQIGQSVTAFRAMPDWGNLFAKQQPLKTLNTASPEETFPVVVESFIGVSVAAINHNGPKAYLHQSVQAMRAWRQANSISPDSSRTFNLFKGERCQEELEIEMTIAVSITAEQQVSLATDISNSDYFYLDKIASMHCARITVEGDKQLQKAIAWLYGYWLINSDYQLTQSPLFIERLNIEQEAKPNTINIYLPVRQA